MNNPFFLNDFIIHSNIAYYLTAIKNDIPHIIFYGPNSSGKKSLLYAFINNIYNNTICIQKYKNIKYDEITVNNNSIPIQYIQSPYHFEFNLSEYGLCDRDVLTNYIKKIIEYKTVDKHYRIIVLHHFDRISKETQSILTTLMEKYIETSRFILTCENMNNICNNIYSRILPIKVPYPSRDTIIKAIHKDIPQISINHIDILIKYCNFKLFNINQYLYIIKDEILINPNTILTDAKFNDILAIEKPLNIINVLLPYIIKKDIQSIKSIRLILYDYLLGNVSIKEIFKDIINYIMQHKSISSICKQSFLCDINNTITNIDNVEYNIIIIEYLILKVKKLLLLNNVA